MAALVHVALGFAAKPIGKKVPVGLAIIAAEILDLLAILLSIIGIEKMGYAPWSDGS